MLRVRIIVIGILCEVLEFECEFQVDLLEFGVGDSGEQCVIDKS